MLVVVSAKFNGGIDMRRSYRMKRADVKTADNSPGGGLIATCRATPPPHLVRFDVRGFSLFVAAGFSVGVFYLFAAVLAWQLGGLRAETLAAMRVIVWALALCFAAITVVSWRYLLILPIVFQSRLQCE